MGCTMRPESGSWLFNPAMLLVYYHTKRCYIRILDDGRELAILEPPVVSALQTRKSLRTEKKPETAQIQPPTCQTSSE